MGPFGAQKEPIKTVFPGKSKGSGFSLSGETFRSPYQIGVRLGPADCFANKTQYFSHMTAWSTAIYSAPAFCCAGALLFAVLARDCVCKYCK